MKKFVLVPLLIIGMFISFTAAIVAMLFFTKTVQTPEQLRELVLGDADSTRLADDFRLKEDKLGELWRVAEEYKSRYEEQLESTQKLQDSLLTERGQLDTKLDSLMARERFLEGKEDSVFKRLQKENLKDLAKTYNALKPAAAAEILQLGQLNDTTTAKLLKSLDPNRSAKIMNVMDPEYAAKITKIMQVLPR